MREIYLQEGKMSTGVPAIDSMRKRLEGMITAAHASLKWLEDHEEKIQEQVSREEAEKNEAEYIAKAIKESLDMQEHIRQNTKLLIERDGWDAKWGMPQMRLESCRVHVLQSQ